MANFIRGGNPIWSFVDPQTGLPLNDEYFAFFLTNTLPYLPQPIYMDNQGQTVWPGYVVELTAGGTLPQNLFFDDTLVYRIQIRHGNSSVDTLVYDIPDFIPGEEPINPDAGEQVVTENQISNPQFQYVNFSAAAASPYTITLAGIYNIAPGWQLVLLGSGSTVLTQVVLQGSDNIDNNPAYALSIKNSGWTSAVLQQTFYGNGALWANEAVSAQVTGEALIVNQPLSILYLDSSGFEAIIAEGVLSTGQFSTIEGAIALDASTNTNPSNISYTQIQIILPNNGGLTLTNIFVFGQTNPLPIPVVETTPESQLNDLFHYYANSLIIQPKDTLVVGWNFRQNPYQFVNLAAAITISTTPVYVADQTIMGASTPNSVAVTVTQPSASLPFGLLKAQAIVTTTQGQIFWMQYVDAVTIQGWWGTNVSVLVRARLFTTGSTTIRLKCRIFTCNSLPNVLSATDPITGFDANGDPVFASGYATRMAPNDPSYPLLNTWDTKVSPPVCVPIAFNTIPNAIQLTSQQNATMGVLIYTQGTLNASLGDSIVIDSISVVPNDFAIDTTPKTYDEVLRECEYYFETSYDYQVAIGTVTPNSSSFTEQLAITNGSTVGLVARSIPIRYRTVKRAPPSNIGLRSTLTGTNGQVAAFIRNNGAAVSGNDVALSNWSLTNVGQKSCVFIPNTGVSLVTAGSLTSINPETYITYHYTINAQLGV